MSGALPRSLAVLPTPRRPRTSGPSSCVSMRAAWALRRSTARLSALRFLFTVTLKRRDLARVLVIIRYLRKLPDVLSVEEAARLLQAAPGIKYEAALGVAYGAGLRVSEVAQPQGG